MNKSRIRSCLSSYSLSSASVTPPNVRCFQLLLRELDQFVVEQFLIVRFHDMTSGRSRTSRTVGGMTGCPKRLDAGNDGAMITSKLEILSNVNNSATIWIRMT
jgi:hypothetical protein